ncbi:hypothetical protein AALO_G00034370 [Alosa alosa]|uniref:Uncharacterized protein n=1 Tax=Alosa alosa TaxID=278164 RepID=A0AAV6HCN3_9TELE|nr:hypothetical protein AALO_G00034370 [Alosa alosa]
MEWIYTSTRISHLLTMLNSDDKDVRVLARSSLFLDLRRRKVPLARESDPHFLGFKRKNSGKLDTRSADMSQEQRTSAMAVAGAIMGAILALFLITVFTIVLLTARKAPPPAYTDKVIDLPPTHKPPPPYSERRPSGIPARPVPPQVVTFKQVRQVADRRYEMAERPVIRTTQREMQSPIHQPLSYQEWVCHQNGADRVYINHREHYV